MEIIYDYKGTIKREKVQNLKLGKRITECPLPKD